MENSPVVDNDLLKLLVEEVSNCDGCASKFDVLVIVESQIKTAHVSPNIHNAIENLCHHYSVKMFKVGGYNLLLKSWWCEKLSAGCSI